MDIRTAVPLSMEQALDGFFASSSVLRHPAVWVRSRGLRSRLESYLDAECELWLTDPELTLVHAERQIDALGAVPQVAGPEALVHALPGFLQPAWLPEGRGETQVQLIVVVELAGWLARNGLVDREALACPLLDVEVCVAQVRQRLSR